MTGFSDLTCNYLIRNVELTCMQTIRARRSYGKRSSPMPIRPSTFAPKLIHFAFRLAKTKIAGPGDISEWAMRSFILLRYNRNFFLDKENLASAMHEVQVQRY